MPNQKVRSKLAVAIVALFTCYLRLIHREGIDRCCIITVNDKFRVQVDFTSSIADLAATLRAILAAGCSGGTKLYDSLEDMVHLFWRAGRPNCQWNAFVLTDGGDNLSRRYPHDNRISPEILGRYLGTRFNHEPRNGITLFGVGSGQEIHAGALATMGRYGNFPALKVDAFPFFARDRTRHVRVSPQPIDYVIIIDTSESMGRPATQG